MKKWTALFFCATSCLVSLHLGQDNNYDLKNYHIYNAWALSTGARIEKFSSTRALTLAADDGSR